VFNQEFIANPYAHYQKWLEGERIFWSKQFFGGAWVLPHYKDSVELLRDNGEYLTTEKAGGMFGQFPPEYQAELLDLEYYIARWLAFIDPPKHIRIRRLLQKGFTNEVVNSFRPRTRQIVDELLDKAIAKGTGEMDMVSEFAYQLPVRVVSAMMGIPDSDHPQFMTWMDNLARFMGNAAANIEDARVAKEAMSNITGYFRNLLPERKKQPGTDIISYLIAAEESGDVLSEEELYAQCVFFLFAGHETTSNLIGNSLYSLLRHPEQFALLRQQPDLIGSMVEETCRYESPFQYTFRMARTDFELHGQTIHKGQVLIFLFGAANRDSEFFPDPQTYDITRKKNQHLTFGYGLHHCIGASTARMELDVAYTAILERLPNLRLLNATPEWHAVFRFRGLKTLPLAFEERG
jgi:cytochrome P450